MCQASDEITDNEINVRSLVRAKQHRRSRRESVPTPGRLELLSRRHNTLSHLQNFFTDATKAPKNALQRRWEYRWTAASGAWFAGLFVLLLGGIDWRAVVMVAAAAFMLARGGDMLDDVDER
jgi:hypothetical protein